MARWCPRAFGGSYLRASNLSGERGRGDGEGGDVGGARGAGHGRSRRWRWGGRGRSQAVFSAASSSSPYYGDGSSGSSNKQGTDKTFSLDALGRGPGRADASSHQTTIRCEPGVWSGRRRERGNDDFGGGDESCCHEGIELGERRVVGVERGRDEAAQVGIQVVTVVEQEVEKGGVPVSHGRSGACRDARSEEGSDERELVGGSRRGGDSSHC